MHALVQPLTPTPHPPTHSPLDILSYTVFWGYNTYLVSQVDVVNNFLGSFIPNYEGLLSTSCICIIKMLLTL